MEAGAGAWGVVGLVSCSSADGGPVPNIVFLSLCLDCVCAYDLSLTLSVSVHVVCLSRSLIHSLNLSVSLSLK